MPTITTETQAAGVANALISAVQQLVGPNGIVAQINAASSLWTNISAATLLNAFPTYTPTSTGGIGSVDGSPNVAHPINISINPGAELTRAISANNIAGIFTALQGIAAACGGTAVSANGAIPQLFATCL